MADGDLDLLFVNPEAEHELMLNDIKGEFKSADAFTEGISVTFVIDVADFTGDGHLDLVVGNNGEPNELWLNGMPV